MHEGQADGDFLVAELDGRAEHDQGNIMFHACSVKVFMDNQAVWLMFFQRVVKVNSPYYNSEIWWPYKQKQ